MPKTVKRVINLHPSEWHSAESTKPEVVVMPPPAVAVNAAATTSTTALAALLAPTDVEYQLPAATIRSAENIDDDGTNIANKRVRYMKQSQPDSQNFQDAFMKSPLGGAKKYQTVGFKQTQAGTILTTSSSLPSTVKDVFLVQNGNLVQICHTESAIKSKLPQRRLTISHGIPTPPAVPNPLPPPAVPKPLPPLAALQPPKSTLTDNVTTKQVTKQPVPIWDFDIDSQNTDSDEDGYSNIDFDDDDYQIVEPEEHVDEYDPAWAPALRNPCKVFNYAAEMQPKLKEPAPHSPLSYFDMIIGPRAQFFRKLAHSCMIYAVNKLGPQSSFQTFTPEELQKFMGICLQMSSLRLHSLDEYWNNDANFGFHGIEDKMTLNRFKKILEALNFEMFKYDATTHSAGRFHGMGRIFDKFADVRPLLNFFTSRMETIYDCDRSLILNEPVLYWKGKFHWLNEVKTKFRCNAVLLHFLTEPSGLLLRIVPDLETVERKNFNLNSKEIVQQRLSIALEALQSNIKKGHIVYASKHYSSYALAMELAKRQTYCAGFLDPTRYGNCKELVLTSIEKERSIVRFAEGIMTGKYRQGHKSIYFYSSDCQAIFANEKQNTQTSIGNLVKEIKMHLHSNSDLHSKMLNCQILFDAAEIKWDKRLMIYVFNLIVLNAYILYTKHAGFLQDELPIRYQKFRQEVIASLINTDLESWHTIQMLPRLNGKMAKKKCQICCKGGLNTYSKFFCEMCAGLPGLCEKPCFKIWHDQMNKSMKSTELEDEDMPELQSNAASVL